MGVSLTYSTTEPVLAEVRRAILADAARLNAERSWWCESFIFFEADSKKKGGPTELAGDTKLFLADDTDDDDDEFMGYRDATFIIRHLVLWSREHGVNWSLGMVGMDLGTVTNGDVHPPGLLGWDQPETSEDRQRAEQRDRKYALRKG